jgi:hypothetical protein
MPSVPGDALVDMHGGLILNAISHLQKSAELAGFVEAVGTQEEDLSQASILHVEQATARMQRARMGDIPSDGSSDETCGLVVLDGSD